MRCRARPGPWGRQTPLPWVSIPCAFPDPTPPPLLLALALTVARARQWNLYHCSVTADILTETAAAMVKTGLKDAGYIYVNRRAPSRPLPPAPLLPGLHADRR